MTMKIVFNGHNIIIQSIFPVERSLQFSALNSDVSFEILKELKTYTGTIEYYEDDVLMMEYVNYHENFECLYSSDSFNINLSQISEQEMVVQNLKSTVTDNKNFLDSAICELTMFIAMMPSV